MSLVTSTDHPKFLTKPAGAHRRVLFLPILRRGSDRRPPNCSGFVIRPALCELCRLNFPRVTARYRGDLRRPPAASIQTDPLPDVRHPRRGGGGTASRRARRLASRFARRQHPGPRRSSGALQPVHRVGRRRQAVRLLVGPNGRTMPTPEDGPARQVTERIYVEITNALRAAGSALDVLGGLTVPFLGLPVSPPFADTRRLLRCEPVSTGGPPKERRDQRFGPATRDAALPPRRQPDLSDAESVLIGSTYQDICLAGSRPSWALSVCFRPSRTRRRWKVRSRAVARTGSQR